MTERKQKLFASIVTQHIRSAEPVSSLWLAEETGLNVSSATIRNDLKALEEDGLLTHPHTSSGRIPTEAGYRHYLSNHFESQELSEEEKASLKKAGGDIRELAKAMSELSQTAVFIAFDPKSTYFTGFSAVANQPEFTDVPLLQHLTEIVDQMNDDITELFSRENDGTEILIGEENPLSKNCSLIYSQMRDGTIIGMLGPLRMDYEAHVARLNYAKNHYEQTQEKTV